MIQNEREYKISKAEAQKFRQAIVQLEQQSTEDWKIELQKNAMQSSLEELEQEILEYNQLKNSPTPIALTLSSFEQIPDALIQARIAKGWTQAELASRMGVKPQQVQNDEITHYQSANFARLTRVAKVLGMEFENARIMVGWIGNPSKPPPQNGRGCVGLSQSGNTRVQKSCSEGLKMRVDTLTPRW